ncbi:Uu.00g059720.m01.CDS01 [Anthostomella pinea]|uniref:Uu.00g059720.m01.CDS01 n=1 Tax=Anthostomella pinea TaxID=933095 RepID=A0AAI8VS48_9PEZI|nr:Uu.00g059720.m01.CDS01 [Anthostomella pinea]
MEFHYSQVVDPPAWNSQGLCDGLPLREHLNPELEVAGVNRLRDDWEKFVGPIPPGSNRGCLGSPHHMCSFAIPECLPERLELVAYIMEFGFLHDDLIDTFENAEADVQNEGIRKALKDMLSGEPSGEGQILLTMIKEMTSIDPAGANEMMSYWDQELSLARDRPDITTFDDYLEYRIVDCGATFAIALATFGMSLNVSQAEMDECFRLARPAFAANADQRRPDAIDEDEAKRQVLKKVNSLIGDHIQTWEETKGRRDLSPDAQRLMESVQYMISGNFIWGNTCPRYHQEQSPAEVEAVGAFIESEKPEHTNTSDYGSGDSTAADPDEPSGSTDDLVIEDDVRDLDDAINQTSAEEKGVGHDGIPSDSIHQYRSAGKADPSTNRDLPALSSATICAPARYIESLPSKNIRDKAAVAFNVWFNMPSSGACNHKARHQHRAQRLAHEMDDIQDVSDTCRGKPSTHTVFGVAQTINSAGYLIIKALEEVKSLQDLACVEIFIGDKLSVHHGNY